MASTKKTEVPKVKARPKVASTTRSKTITPKQLATQWGMDPKRVRRYLRLIWETTHEPWELTPKMVDELATKMGVDPKTGKKV